MRARVLVALEDEYRAYREVLAAGIKASRPEVEVETTVPADVGAKKASFEPQVVISSSAEVTDVGDTIAWVTLATDPSRPTKVRLREQRFEHSNPNFVELLDLVDEACHLTDRREGKRRDRLPCGPGSLGDPRPEETGEKHTP